MIGSADCAGLNTHEHVPRPGRGLRDPFDVYDFWAPEAVRFRRPSLDAPPAWRRQQGSDTGHDGRPRNSPSVAATGLGTTPSVWGLVPTLKAAAGCRGVADDGTMRVLMVGDLHGDAGARSMVFESHLLGTC
jgi:hypothetical protein